MIDGAQPGVLVVVSAVVPPSGHYGKSAGWCLGGSRDAPSPRRLHSGRRQWTGDGEGQALAKPRDVKRAGHGSSPI
jgi:hypothetical protein